MERRIIKPSNYDYDNKNKIVDILGEYSNYLNFLSDRDLKIEFRDVCDEFLTNPIPYNVLRYHAAENKMREKGFDIGYKQTTSTEESARE